MKIRKKAKEKLKKENKKLKKKIRSLQVELESLKTSEKVFRRIYEDAPLGIALVNENGVFINVNRSMCEIVGYDETELINRSVESITHPDDWETEIELIRSLKGTDEDKISFNKRYIKKNDEVVWANLLTTIIKDEDNNFLFALGIVEDITKQLASKQNLESSLKEKEVLLREIHHRVKNNLNIITGLLELQSDGITDENLKKKLMESVQRVRSMAMLHERLYTKTDISRINLASYIKELVNYLIAAFSNRTEIITDYNMDEVEISLDQAVPCGLIVNEVITNSLKYAFDGEYEGVITILLHNDEDYLNITISDNGKGIPESVNTSNPETLGLQLIRLLVYQLLGRLEITNDNGTVYKISFPLEND